MDREIKFRGKRIDNGEWVYGNLIYSSDACKEYETLIIPQKDADGFTTDYTSNGENKESYGFDNWSCVIPETVGQYTRFKDKNGKEIYEGDIVEFLDTGEEGYEYKEGYDFNNIASIVWENGRFELDNIYVNNSAVLEFMNSESHEEFIDELMHDCEIIGNIHDNPELLEVV